MNTNSSNSRFSMVNCTHKNKEWWGISVPHIWVPTHAPRMERQQGGHWWGQGSTLEASQYWAGLLGSGKDKLSNEKSRIWWIKYKWSCLRPFTKEVGNFIYFVNKIMGWRGLLKVTISWWISREENSLWILIFIF